MDRDQDLADAPRGPGPRALLHALFDAAPEAVVLVDEHDVVVGWNPAAQALFSWAPDEAVAQPFAELIVAEADRATYRDAIDPGPAGIADHARARNVECVLRCRDRSTLSAMLVMTDASEDGRRFTALQVRDLSVLRVAQRERNSARDRFHSFLQNAPLPIAALSPAGVVQLANRETTEYYGRSVEELGRFDRGAFAAYWPEFDDVVADMPMRVFRTGTPETLETRMYSERHGELRSIRLSQFPVFEDVDGRRETVQVGSITLDITEMVNARKELERTAAELRDQRALFRAFVDNAPIPMSANRHDGSFIFANRRSAEFYGVPVEQMPHIDIEKVRRNAPGFEKDVIEPGQRVFTTGETVISETRVFSRLQNEMRTVQFTFFPIHEEVDGERRITRAGTICYDVTDIRRAQQEQARVSARLTQFIERAPMAVTLADRDGRLLMVNQAAAQHFGAPVDELVGKSMLDLAHLAGSKDGTPRLIARMQSGKAIRFAAEFDVHARDMDEPEAEEATASRWRIMDMTFFPIHDAAGVVTEIGAFGLDVTQVRRAQDRLAAQQATLHQSEKLAALGQLLAGVAHELNNPLAIVKGRAAILKEKLEGSQHEAAITKLGDAADRCARIVKTFLAMARKVGPQRMPVDVNEMVRSALDLTASGLRRAEVEVRTTLAQQLPHIETDGDQLVQALMNLIVNAQHALESHEGVRQLAISTRLEGTGQRVLIEVADTGPGIPAQLAARVFEPFFTSKEVGKGTGLGLSVSKGMVEANGGELVFLATPGGGATFRIALPLIAPSVQHEDTSTGEPEHAPRTLRALVVDDEPDLAEILAEILGSLGFECVLAGNGRLALEALSSSAFDAIFCDVRMPEMDGIAFLSRLERDWPAHLSRLAFVSGDLLHGDVMKLVADARCPVIEKPFDPAQVRAVALALVAAGVQS